MTQCYIFHCEFVEKVFSSAFENTVTSYLSSTIFIKNKKRKLFYTPHPLNRHKLSYLAILIVFWSMTACNVHRYLKNDEYIVRKNTVKIYNLENRRAKKQLGLEIPTLFKQKDLPDFVGIKSKSGAYFYLKGLTYDTSTPRLRRWVARNFGKKPTFFDAAQTNSTVKNIRQYLINSGYLYPTVYFEKDFHGQDKGFADIIYYIDPGRLYVLDTVSFFCADTSIQYLISDTRDKSILKKEAPLSQRLYEQEKLRITELLNNAGYARFTSNFISQLEADTLDTGWDAFGNRRVNVSLRVQLPTDRPTHQKFYTADVIIYPNYDARLGETIAKDTIVNGKIFFTYDGNLKIRAGTLADAIKINPGEQYNRSKTDKTLQLITGLGTYRFVNIKPNIEECDSTLITYKVYLTPNKRMSFESGLELNYSNIASVAANSQRSNFGRIGAAIDFAFDHKNLFKGAEKFRSTLSAGVDAALINANQTTNNLSFDIRNENTLSILKFVNALKTYSFYRRVGLLNKNFLQELKENASTDISIGFDFTDRLGLNLYRYQQFRVNQKHTLRKSNGIEGYQISQSGVELNLGKLADSSPFQNNERFKRSLQNQLITGFLFKRLTYERSLPVSILNERWQITASIEQSGTEVRLAEHLFNKSQPFLLFNNLLFSKYWLGDSDIRFTKQYTAKRAFSARAAIGLAMPFGNEPVPYSRQFFVGGPNSIRGWLLRDIGPGGYRDTSQRITLPYQSGDFKFEFNSEYRFPVFWRLESALFFDFGNIWNLKSDKNLPNGELNKFFYDQLAVSTGLGLRIDVTYALIRLDFGFRLRNPYPDENGQHWIPMSTYSWRRNVNPNFALGLPF